MTIPFIFVLTWIIPDAKGLSKSEVSALVEDARQLSISRIRKYSGYSFVASFFIPPIVYSIVFVALGLFSNRMSFVFVGLVGAASVISSYFLVSIFNTLILKPIICDQLKRSEKYRGEHRKP